MPMEQARDLILAALDQVQEITPAGSSSLLAVAARALDPTAPITREGLTQTLGLHPSLIIGALVAADFAGNSEARRALGRRLFSGLELRGQPPALSPAGQLSCCVHGLEQLEALEVLQGGLVTEVLRLARAAMAGQPADPLSLRAAEQQAEELQRTKVVPVEKGPRTRLAIPPEEAARRRGAQAMRAVLTGLKDPSPSEHLSSTVAGEVAACLCLQRGVEVAVNFLLSLAALIEALPPEQARRPAAN